MSKLATQAERLKLARLLDVPGDALTALDSLDPDSLRTLREQVSDAFFAADEKLFQRIALASKLLPATVIALIAEKVLGPMLSGRVAGQLSPEAAVAVAKRLPIPFLAELSLSLDPMRAEAIIATIPPSIIAPVAVELARCEAFISMARFVGVINDEAMQAVLAALDDNTALLKTAFFIERKARLNDLLGLLDETRLVAIIEAAASEDDLWPEALGLLEHVDDHWKTTLGNLAAGLDPQVLDTMVASVHRNDLWAAALPVVTLMSAASQSRFANLARLHDDRVMADLMRAASAEGLWAQVLPLVPQMNEAGRALAARLSGELDGEQLLAVAAAATEQHHWSVVIDLIERMAPEQQRSVFGLLGVAPAESLDGLLQALAAGQQWPLLQAALPQMTAAHRARLSARAEALGFEADLSPSGQATSLPDCAQHAPSVKGPAKIAPKVTPERAAPPHPDLAALRLAQRKLEDDLRRALDAASDLRDLTDATALANKALRQDAQRTSRWAAFAVCLAILAVAGAMAALMI